jgi:CubicO group peptidase (beta-lactamase class C family)
MTVAFSTLLRGIQAGAHAGCRGLIVCLALALAMFPIIRAKARAAPYVPAANLDGAPGCASGAFRRGHVVEERDSGFADVENHVLISPTTVFDIGSISKQFTAMAILLLAAERRLDLSSSIRAYLPTLPQVTQDITVSDLLHQTSGLRDYLELLAADGHSLDDDLITNQMAFEIVRRQSGLNFAPGSAYQYSNSNYLLLGKIVERISGSSLKEYLSRHIFDPLKMNQTTLRDNVHAIVPHRAFSYVADPRLETGADRNQVTGDGGVFTTLADLAKWDANFANPKVGTPQLIHAMEEPGRLRDGRRIAYGAGLELSSYRGRKTYEHGGAEAGYHAYYIRIPSLELSAAALCNTRGSGSPSPYVLAIQRLDTFVPKLVAERSQSKPIARQAVNESDLPRFAGYYIEPEDGTVLNIEYRAGSLFATDDIQIELNYQKLTVLNARTLRDGMNATYQFNRDRNALVAYTPGAAQVFRRVAGPAITLDPKYAGVYESPGFDVAWRLIIRGRHMYLAIPGRDEEELAPVARDTFYSVRWTIAFDRGANDSITGLTVRNARLFGLAFKKL